MGRHYVSAREALPEELLKAVCDAVGGRPVFMWIPGRRNLNKDDRDQRILGLHAQGYTVAAIADRMFLSQRTVWRVLARARAQRETAAKQTASEGDGNTAMPAAAG